jgi:hypothetical protein
MSEIVVGLTDYGLALECALFAGWLMKIEGGWPEVRRFFTVFFLALAASLTGGTYHVVYSDSTSATAVALWWMTMVALGVVAFATWSLGACLLFGRSAGSLVVKAALLEFLAYSIYVVAVDDRFWVAIANYAPAVIFLGAAFAHGYRRRSELPLAIGVIGLGVTVLAAVIQRLGLSLHPVYFNHNATYHLVQAIGLFLIFRAAVFLAHKPVQGD